MTRRRRALGALGCAAALLVSGPVTAQPVQAPPATGAGVVSWDSDVPAGWPAPPAATASAYILVDADSGQVLAARNADERRPVASTIKLLTVLTALDVLDLDAAVTVGDEVGVGGAGVGLVPGMTWTVRDLVDAVLIRSGNDAARALAVAAAGDISGFVDLMVDKAAQLGVDGATIGDPTGLDDVNLLSARDLVVIAMAARADDVIRETAARPSVTLPGQEPMENRNLLLGTYAGATGLKTGYTDAAGWSLVATARAGEADLVAVVLGARVDQARFDEAAALFDHAKGALSATTSAALSVATAGGAAAVVGAPTTVWSPGGVEARGTLEDRGGTLTWVLHVGRDEVASAELAEPAVAAASGIGARLTEAVHRSMRRGHVVDAWPASPTTAQGLG